MVAMLLIPMLTVSFPDISISESSFADPHIDTLTTLLYWSMIETGLALIAACLPTLHYIVARSSIKAMLSSVRSAIGLNSAGSRSTTTPGAENENSQYSKIVVMKKISQTSQCDSIQVSENDFVLHDSENGYQIPLVPANTWQARIKNTA
jgi:hypothetical protein